MANSIAWLDPATGAVDPTAAQVAQQSTVTADVTIDGTGTTFTVTHNMALSAADLLLGFPTIVIIPTSVHATDGTGAARIGTILTNSFVITFITGVAQTLRLIISRPHTLTR